MILQKLRGWLSRPNVEHSTILLRKGRNYRVMMGVIVKDYGDFVLFTHSLLHGCQDTRDVPFPKIPQM